MQAGPRIALQIEDDGIGFDASETLPGHYGLVGLREQAQLIGADLQIRSAPNQGRAVTATLRIAPEILWPLEAPAHPI